MCIVHQVLFFNLPKNSDKSVEIINWSTSHPRSTIYWLFPSIDIPEIPQSRFGDKPFKLQVVCPQNGTGVLKGLTDHGVFRILSRGFLGTSFAWDRDRPHEIRLQYALWASWRWWWSTVWTVVLIQRRCWLFFVCFIFLNIVSPTSWKAHQKYQVCAYQVGMYLRYHGNQTATQLIHTAVMSLCAWPTNNKIV